MHRYRIWIARFHDWSPHRWYEVPPAAVAEEPADEGSFAAEEAADFVRGFNLTALAAGSPLWAVAVPVRILYDKDLIPGALVTAPQLAAFTSRGIRRGA